MSTEQQVNWFVGSNGNQFADHGDWRYCIAKNKDGTYRIARNGNEIGQASCFADAKLFVMRECR